VVNVLPARRAALVVIVVVRSSPRQVVRVSRFLRTSRSGRALPPLLAFSIFSTSAIRPRRRIRPDGAGIGSASGAISLSSSALWL